MIWKLEISFVCFINVLAVSKGCSLYCLNDKCDDTTGICDECPDDRYGNYCGLDCKICKNEQCDRLHCTEGCKSGYYQVHGQNYSDCYQCLTNCFTCQNPYECIKCNDGYFVHVASDVHSCERCNWNCVCSTINDCISCLPGFYGSICEYNCLTLLPNCSLCYGNTYNNVKCSQCDEGLILIDNKCEADDSHTCPNNCTSCSTNNLCESCKEGWHGSQCDKACSDDIDHCIACQETNDVLTCTSCHDEYKLSNGACLSITTQSVTSTSKTVDPTTSHTESVLSTSTTVSGPLHTASVLQNIDSFQTSTFVVGLVSGFGICLCSVFLVGMICFLKRRKRLKQNDQATPLHGQNAPFYENSITAGALRLNTARSEGQRQENTEQVNVTDDNTTYENTRQTHTSGESSAHIEISSSPNDDQHNYTSLTIGEGEHVYKDLTSM